MISLCFYLQSGQRGRLSGESVKVAGYARSYLTRKNKGQEKIKSMDNHIDDKKRRLNVVKDTLIEKGESSEKKLNETKLIILKELIKKLDWPTTEIESKY